MKFHGKLFPWVSKVLVPCFFCPLLLMSGISRAGEAVTCGDGIPDETNSTCYVYRSEARIWQESELDCQSIGAHLASPQSVEDQNAIRVVLEANGVAEDDVWIGGRLEQPNPPSSRLWRWISDCLHCGRDTDLRLAVSPQGCYRDSPSVPDLAYNISDVTRSLTPAVCIEACLRHGFWFSGVQSGNRCYCGNEFGRYGPIESSVDADNCVVSCSGDSSLRCGGPGLNFVYYNPGGYAEWGYARPNNYGGYQTCALLNQRVEYKFDDDDCGRTTADYICDIPASKCSNVSVVSNKTCYYISKNESVTWFEARQRCLKRGGDLVKVKDQTELNYLKNSVNATKHWTGLTCLVWFWTNGNDLTYSNWYNVGSDRAGWEPNDRSNECLLLSPRKNFQWTDGNCNLPHSYLCQRSTVSTKFSTDSSSDFRPTTNFVSASSADSTKDPDTFTSLDRAALHNSPNHTLNPNAESTYWTNTSEEFQARQSVDRITSLSNVEIALICLCVIFLIVFLVTVLLILCYCCIHRKNKIDGEKVSDDTENSSKSSTSLNSGNRNATSEDFEGNSERTTKLIVN